MTQPTIHPYGPAIEAIWAGLGEMDKEQRYRWMDKLFWKRLSNEIRVNREVRGWTQAELSKRCGVAQPTVALWENHKKIRGITIKTLCRIAAAFDCALVIEFVSWGEWVKLIVTPVGPVISFKDDHAFHQERGA